MPRDILAAIEEKANQKLAWIKKRLVDICLEVENVAKWDKIQEDFNDKVSEIQRKYPKATIPALQSFIQQIPDSKMVRSLGVVNTFKKEEEDNEQ